ncbi:MAG: hypothetical protein KDA80_07185 [Planctomycetaceae bacterium]|nr:hypothetical protein [Planctomycetaceae bacterium]
MKEASSEVWLLDLVSLFENHTKHASPGRDLFLEHVHMTIDGHWLTAKGLAEKLVVEVLNRTWHPENVPSATERDEFLHLRTEDRLVAMTLASFIYASRPFRESIDREKHVEALLHEIRRLTESLSPEERIAYESLDHATKMHDLIDGLGRFHLAAGRWKEAEDFFQSSMERRPWMPNGYVFTAVTRHLQNDETTARTYLKASYHTVVPETAPLVKDRQRLIREMGQREAL